MIRGESDALNWPNSRLVTSVINGALALNGFGRKLLGTLNTSHRKSTRWVSLIAKLRDNPILRSQRPGPATLRVPALPSVPTAGAVNTQSGVTGVGATHALPNQNEFGLPE